MDLRGIVVFLICFHVYLCYAKPHHKPHQRGGANCLSRGGTCFRIGKMPCDGEVDTAIEGCSRRSACCLPKNDQPEEISSVPLPDPGTDQCGLVTAVSSSVPEPMLRIVGGQTSIQGEWPWQVGFEDDYGHFCGGTLINNQWVITAAHCLERVTTDMVKAYVGEHYLLSKTDHEELISVDKWIVHPNYSARDAGMPNDIALVKLNKSVDTTGNYVRTACLPGHGDAFDEYDDCAISGWGYTMGTADGNFLQHLRIKITSRDSCNETWRGVINNNHVCIGDGDIGACRGDSGGPLVCLRDGHFTLAGITSWGSMSCQEYGYPNIFTLVTPYLEWINTYITPAS